MPEPPDPIRPTKRLCQNPRSQSYFKNVHQSVESKNPAIPSCSESTVELMVARL